MIYFIQAGKAGPIKIGTSDNPQLRLSQLQTSNPKRLHLLGVMVGDADIEAEIHQSFNSFRLNGEWFSPTSQLLKFISENTGFPLESGEINIQFLEKEFRAAKSLGLNMGLDMQTAIQKANDLILSSTGISCADLLGISLYRKPGSSFDLWWNDWKHNRFKNPVLINEIYDDYSRNVSEPVPKNRLSKLLKQVVKFKRYKPRSDNGKRLAYYRFE